MKVQSPKNKVKDYGAYDYEVKQKDYPSPRVEPVSPRQAQSVILP